MSYEIPQQLEYKEKIIFGLTFGQLLYAIIFLPIALALLFKLPFNLYIRIALALIPSGMAAVFMFTEIPKIIKNWYKWLGWKELSLYNENGEFNQKMKNFLSLEKIEDDILHLKKYVIHGVL